MKGKAPATVVKQVRGAATVEALLVLSTFFIIWAGVNFLGNLYQGKMLAQAVARSCAWRISVGGCEKIPDNCSATSASSNSGTAKAENLKGESRNATGGQEDASPLQRQLDSEVEGLFSQRISATGGKVVEQPILLGAEGSTVGASYSLPCNSKPQSVLNLASEVFGNFLGK